MWSPQDPACLRDPLAGSGSWPQNWQAYSANYVVQLLCEVASDAVTLKILY